MKRGELWDVHFPLNARENSEPYGHGPAVIISADWANNSAIRTVLVAVLSTNLKLAKAPGNIYVAASTLNGLRGDSVVNVAQLLVLDKSRLEDRRGQLSISELQALDAGLRQMLNLVP